jgi:hypothetical protein
MRSSFFRGHVRDALGCIGLFGGLRHYISAIFLGYTGLGFGFFVSNRNRRVREVGRRKKSNHLLFLGDIKDLEAITLETKYPGTKGRSTYSLSSCIKAKPLSRFGKGIEALVFAVTEFFYLSLREFPRPINSGNTAAGNSIIFGWHFAL